MTVVLTRETNACRLLHRKITFTCLYCMLYCVSPHIHVLCLLLACLNIHLYNFDTIHQLHIELYFILIFIHRDVLSHPSFLSLSFPAISLQPLVSFTHLYALYPNTSIFSLSNLCIDSPQFTEICLLSIYMHIFTVLL